MRDLGAVVLVLPRTVHHGRRDGPVRRAVAEQFVGDQSPGRAPLFFQQLPKESSGRPPIAAWLYEDVEDLAVLVHGSPEILPSALDRQKEFVEIPGVAQPGPKV